MAMKFTVTFLLLISIGEIYSKTLLERIRDDSDLSQVSPFLALMVLCGASPLGSAPKKGRFSPFVAGWTKEEAKKIGKILASARKSVT
jgi:hypothetical protein